MFVTETTKRVLLTVNVIVHSTERAHRNITPNVDPCKTYDGSDATGILFRTARGAPTSAHNALAIVQRFGWEIKNRDGWTSDTDCTVPYCCSASAICIHVTYSYRRVAVDTLPQGSLRSRHGTMVQKRPTPTSPRACGVCSSFTKSVYGARNEW